MPETTTALPIPGLVGDAGVYVSGEDWLRVRSLSDAGGRALLVSGRYLLVNDGRVHPFASRHVPVAGATPATTDIPLGECWLQSITVNAEDGGVLSSPIFVRIDLVRGRGTAGVILATLLQGELSALAGLTWPSAAPPSASGTSGALIVREEPAPAAGNNFTVIVPAGVRWRIRALTFAFVTSAAAGNRHVSINYRTATKSIAQFSAPTTQAASLNWTYTGAQAFAAALVAAATHVLIPIADLTLSAGYRLETNIAALAAGDQLSGIALTVEEAPAIS